MLLNVLLILIEDGFIQQAWWIQCSRKVTWTGTVPSITRNSLEAVDRTLPAIDPITRGDDGGWYFNGGSAPTYLYNADISVYSALNAYALRFYLTDCKTLLGLLRNPFQWSWGREILSKVFFFWFCASLNTLLLRVENVQFVWNAGKGHIPRANDVPRTYKYGKSWRHTLLIYGREQEALSPVMSSLLH